MEDASTMGVRVLYTIVIFLIPAANLALAVAVWLRSRHEQGSRLFVLLLLSLFEWTLAYGIQLILPFQSPLKGAFADLQYAGAAAVPVLFLLFVLRFRQQHRPLNSVLRLALVAEAVAFNVLVWTDSLHHLYRTTIGVRVVAGFELRVPTFGPLLWVHTAWVYGLLVWASVVLFGLFARSRRPRRSQAFLLLAAALAPWLGSLINALGLDPTLIESTHYGFLVTAVSLFMATSRFRLFGAGAAHVAERILATMSDVVILADPGGRIAHTNSALTSLLGYEPQELSHRTVGAILADPPWDDLTRLAVGSTDSPSPFTAEATLLGKGGESIHVSATVTPFVDDLRALQGYLIVGRDLTESRRLEQERRTAARLEAVRRMAGGIAHDFNNILAAAALHAEFLSQKLSPGHPLSPSVAGIAAAVARASEQADRLLLFSGASRSAPERVDLNGLIRGVESQLRPDAPSLELDLAPGQIDVLADKELLGRALAILIARAGTVQEAREPVRVHTAVVKGHARAAGDPSAHGAGQACVGVRGPGLRGTADGAERELDLGLPYAVSEHSIDTDLELSAVSGIAEQQGGALRIRPARSGAIEVELLIPLYQG